MKMAEMRIWFFGRNNFYMLEKEHREAVQEFFIESKHSYPEIRGMVGNSYLLDHDLPEMPREKVGYFPGYKIIGTPIEIAYLVEHIYPPAFGLAILDKGEKNGGWAAWIDKGELLFFFRDQKEVDTWRELILPILPTSPPEGEEDDEEYEEDDEDDEDEQ